MDSIPPNNGAAAANESTFHDEVENVTPPSAVAAGTNAAGGVRGEINITTLPPPTPLHRTSRPNNDNSAPEEEEDAAVPISQSLVPPQNDVDGGGDVETKMAVQNPMDGIDSPAAAATAAATLYIQNNATVAQQGEEQRDPTIVKQQHGDIVDQNSTATITATAAATTAGAGIAGCDEIGTRKRGSEQVVAKNEDDHPPVAKKLKLEENEIKEVNNTRNDDDELTQQQPLKDENNNSPPPPPSIQQAATTAIASVGRKDRKEFTASEKLHILSLLENIHHQQSNTPNGAVSVIEQQHQPPTMTTKQLLKKYSVSKSSLHRWKQQKHRLQQLVANEGMGNRKRDTRDLLIKIKLGLKDFVDENERRGPESKLAITTPVIQTQAGVIREELLGRYENRMQADADEGGSKKDEDELNNLLLSEEEYNAIKLFTVTKSWAGRVASSMGMLSSPRKPKNSKGGAKKEGSTTFDFVTNNNGVASEATTPTSDTETMATAANTSETEKQPWAKLVSANQQQDQIASIEQAKQNTAQFLSQRSNHSSSSSPHPPKPKKERREFSALEKLHILQEMETENLKMEQVCTKYHTSKSSVFRWKIQRKSGALDAMVGPDQNRGHCKRVMEDKLVKIKLELKRFVEANAALPLDRRAPVNGTVLQVKAQEARDSLLLRHEEDPSLGVLTMEEEFALRNFKASKGWARSVAGRYGWKVGGNSIAAMDVGGGGVAQVEGGGGMFAEGEQHYAVEVPGTEDSAVAVVDAIIIPAAQHGIPMAEALPHLDAQEVADEQVDHNQNRGTNWDTKEAVNHDDPMQEQQELVNETVDSVMETVAENITISI